MNGIDDKSGDSELSLCEQGRNAFQRAESEKIVNPTAAAAYYVISSQCFIAAAELVEDLETRRALAYLGKAMITNAAFCSTLNGSDELASTHEKYLDGCGGSSNNNNGSLNELRHISSDVDLVSSSNKRIDVVDRGRITGTQKIPKSRMTRTDEMERSRIECLHELEKELAFIGVLQSSLKPPGGNRTLEGNVNSADVLLSDSPAQRSDHNRDFVSSALHSNLPAIREEQHLQKIADAGSYSPGSKYRVVDLVSGIGVLGIGGVMGTFNKILQWHSPTVEPAAKGEDSDYPKKADPAASISQPWEMLGDAGQVSSHSSHHTDRVYSNNNHNHRIEEDPYQSVHLHYSHANPVSAKLQSISSSKEGKSDSSIDQDDVGLKNLMLSMSRLSHENMDLQHKLNELRDLDTKCSEINHAIRKYKEKYDEIISKLPSYRDDGDIAYLRRKLSEAESKCIQWESAFHKAEAENDKLKELSEKMLKDVMKYKKGTKRLASIITQQEEIIKRYEAASTAGEVMVSSRSRASSKSHTASEAPSDELTGDKPSLGAPSSTPRSQNETTSLTTRTTPGVSSPLSAASPPRVNNNKSAIARPNSMGSLVPGNGSFNRSAGAPPLSPAASTFANLRKRESR